MEKIFKNNTIMGIVAVATLALVALMVFRQKKASTPTETLAENQQQGDE